jgi:hypothetical protein
MKFALIALVAMFAAGCAATGDKAPKAACKCVECKCTDCSGGCAHDHSKGTASSCCTNNECCPPGGACKGLACCKPG